MTWYTSEYYYRSLNWVVMSTWKKSSQSYNELKLVLCCLPKLYRRAYIKTLCTCFIDVYCWFRHNAVFTYTRTVTVSNTIRMSLASRHGCVTSKIASPSCLTRVCDRKIREMIRKTNILNWSETDSLQCYIVRFRILGSYVRLLGVNFYNPLSKWTPFLSNCPSHGKIANMDCNHMIM